jgi:uncharacterized membrane protein YecN with MAPEG domain
MPKELLWPAIVTVVSLMVYFGFAGLVGRARGIYNVPAPQTTGNPDFERRLRVQLNTMEQLVIYIPSLWIFSMTLSPTLGAALGAMWIVGRIVYAVGYYNAAKKRGPGFGISTLAMLSLLLGGLVGLIMQLVKAA